MAVDSLGTKRQPQFLDGGAPDIAVDPTAVADYAAYVGNYVVDTTANRTAASAWAWEGLLWRDTTDGFLYERRGGAWVIIRAGVVARAVRTATTPAISNSAFTNLSLNAEWVTSGQGQLDGFSAYSNGWTIPVTGVYEISYELIASLACVFGVSVDNVTPTALDLIAVSAPAATQSFAGAACKRDYRFTAGQVVRLFAIAAAGGTLLRANQGAFGLRWLSA